MDGKSNNILFFDLCRLCLDEQGVFVIFEVDDLPENIHTCMGIELKLSDNLPNKICKTCLEIINNFAQLKTSALKNDNCLRLLLFADKDEIALQKTTEYINDEVIEQDIISYKFSNEPEVRFLSVKRDLFETSPAVKAQDFKEESNTVPKVKIECNSKGEYTCGVCSKVFMKRKQYYLHQRSHNKNLLCPIKLCNKKFATKGDLEKHLRAHTGEKPFQCNECNTSFSQRVSLKAHKINIHNMSAT